MPLVDRLRPRPLGARRHVPEHGELRAPAAPSLGRAPGGTRRVAHRQDELGALAARDGGGARLVRAAARRRHRRRRRRRERVRADRARRRLGAGRVDDRCSRRSSSPRRCSRSSSRSAAVSRCAPCRLRSSPPRSTATTDVVAFSAVQMASGEVADLDAISAAARHHGAMTVVDATQACGWLPLRGELFDVVAAAGYKWLLSPRGTAYMYVAPGRLDGIAPTAAGWFAGEDPFASYFGRPLRLAHDARRLDTSPAWHSWVGAAPALGVLEEIGVAAIHEHDLRLANRFRNGLGLEPGDSAIVFVDAPGAEERLQTAGVRAAVRGGRVRTSWHVYNTDDDVDRALDALTAPDRGQFQVRPQGHCARRRARPPPRRAARPSGTASRAGAPAAHPAPSRPRRSPPSPRTRRT